MWKWLRRFDLEYWQMREALGYPIPYWVDRKWPRRLQTRVGHSASGRMLPHLGGRSRQSRGVFCRFRVR